MRLLLFKRDIFKSRIFLRDDAISWQRHWSISNENTIIENQGICSSQAKTLFFPPQNNSGEISSSRCVAVSVLCLSSLQQWKTENTHWTKHMPCSTFLIYWQQEWIQQPISQQTMWRFQRQWIIPSRLRCETHALSPSFLLPLYNMLDLALCSVLNTPTDPQQVFCKRWLSRQVLAELTWKNRGGLVELAVKSHFSVGWESPSTAGCFPRATTPALSPGCRFFHRLAHPHNFLQNIKIYRCLVTASTGLPNAAEIVTAALPLWLPTQRPANLLLRL